MNKGIETFNKDEKQFFHDFRGKEDLMNKGIETPKKLSKAQTGGGIGVGKKT